MVAGNLWQHAEAKTRPLAASGGVSCVVYLSRKCPSHTQFCKHDKITKFSSIIMFTFCKLHGSRLFKKLSVEANGRPQDIKRLGVKAKGAAQRSLRHLPSGSNFQENFRKEKRFLDPRPNGGFTTYTGRKIANTIREMSRNFPLSKWPILSFSFSFSLYLVKDHSPRTLKLFSASSPPSSLCRILGKLFFENGACSVLMIYANPWPIRGNVARSHFEMKWEDARSDLSLFDAKKRAIKVGQKS